VSLEHSPARNSAAPNLSRRLAYTVQEFCTQICPMSRGFFYEEVKAGRLGIVKNGNRTLVTDDESRRYVAALPSKTPAEAA
jgi:hypothetical protein